MRTAYRSPDYPINEEKDPFPESEAPYDLPMIFGFKRKLKTSSKERRYLMSSWDIIKSYVLE